jgi:H+/Cl- antiporter ClcA
VTEPNATNQAADGRGEGAVRANAGRGPEDGSAPLAIIRLLLIASVLGLVAAFAAVVFEVVVHGVQILLWSNLPDAAGWREPPWWYVLAVPALGGLIVALALRLPGHGEHPPLQGLGTDPSLPSIRACVPAILWPWLIAASARVYRPWRWDRFAQ